MPIDSAKKLTFIHIPKCAGSSLSSALGLKELFSYSWIRDTPNIQFNRTGITQHDLEDILYCHPQHLTARQIEQVVGTEKFWKSFRFSIVRNPFDRLVSEYHYIQQHNVIKAKDYKELSFDQFVTQVLNLPIFTRKIIFDRHLELQHTFVLHEGVRMINKLFRFEEMDACFEYFGITNPPLKMKSWHKSYQEYYTPTLIKKVSDFYRDDLDCFSYKF